MKKIITLFAISCFFITIFVASNISQDPCTGKDIAKVQRMSGKLVFINAEPVQEYEVAFEIKILASGFDSPNDMSNKVVKKALKISEQENKEFDGVIIGSGRVDVAIKFRK